MSGQALQRVCSAAARHVLVGNGPLDPRSTNFDRCRVCGAATTIQPLPDGLVFAREPGDPMVPNTAARNCATVVERIPLDAPPARTRPHCCYIRLRLPLEAFDVARGQLLFAHGVRLAFRASQHASQSLPAQSGQAPEGERWTVSSGFVEHVAGDGWRFVSRLSRVR